MKKLNILFIAALLIAVFLRFYNLPATTRFTRDESSNLRQMHRIYRERDLTLLGPTDLGKTLIHPSLSFYMLMPFAVIGNFTPQSPAYGTAFFGVLTVAVFAMLLKTNKKMMGYAVLLGVFWAPLVIMSRWAWNPHLVPFVQGLAILIYFQKWKWKNIIAGILFGLTFHLHFFAVASFMGFWLILFITDLLNKKTKESFLLGLGFIVSIIPFILFDLKNPPGLFFGAFLRNNLIRTGIVSQNTSMVSEFSSNLYKTLEYLSGGELLVAAILGAMFIFVIGMDFREKKLEPFIYLVPILVQIFFINYLPIYEPRYFYLTLAFFWVWLFYPRKVGLSVIKGAIAIMFLVSLLQLKGILTYPPVEPGGYVADMVTKYVEQKITEDGIKNANIAVLASPDRDALGQIYRHTLDMKGVSFRLENEFDITDNLFVVTTSTEEEVRRDPANIINNFREGPLISSYQIENTDWKVLLFNK